MLRSLLDLDKWQVLMKSLDLFISGMGVTIQVAIFGLLLALALGVLFGVLSTTKLKILQILARIYVEVFQNTPLLVQVFFYYNGLPMVLKALLKTARPVRISKIIIGVIGVGLYHGAYIAEVIRTGIEAIPKGQREAAHSQGFTGLQAMRYIILPQTLKIILPPLANQALNLVKNTSVLALIAGADLMYHADCYASDTSSLQGYFLCAALYFIICFPLAILARHLEKKSKQNPTSKVQKSLKREVA